MGEEKVKSALASRHIDLLTVELLVIMACLRGRCHRRWIYCRSILTKDK
jgi:hypothetical protein